MIDSNFDLIEKLKLEFETNLSVIQNIGQDNITTIELKDDAFDLIKYLKDALGFNFLTDLCGMHYPLEKEYKFSVVYHLHNWNNNIRVRVKCFIKQSPQILSITPLFSSANWQERETYDFYGINFLKHPDLRRILNMDEMDSFPLRKEFPMEDSGRTDKDDRYFGRILKQSN